MLCTTPHLLTILAHAVLKRFACLFLSLLQSNCRRGTLITVTELASKSPKHVLFLTTKPPNYGIDPAKHLSVCMSCRVEDVATKGPFVHSAQKQWTPNGRPTPGSPGKTIPEAPDRRSDDRSKGLLATDLLPTYGKRNQCVVFVLRPSLRLCQFVAQQPPLVLSC